MNSHRITLIHPTGNPNSREAALALAEGGFLDAIITTIAYNPGSPLSNVLNKLPTPLKTAISQELSKRTWKPPEGTTIHTHPWQEILRVALVRSGVPRRLALNNQRLTDWIYTSIDRHVAQSHLKGLDAVYAYEDGAATTFQAAKSQGILCLYDLPILFYQMSRQIQAEEAELFPDLAPALQAAKEPEWKLRRKEQELELADRIFVASSITRQSLLNFGVNPEKISVIPYGAPLGYFHPQPKKEKGFRALYVGRVEPRKGIHYLLNAWKKLKLSDAELCLIGINEFPSGWLDRYQDIFRYIPPIPHYSLNQYYSSASVFVFPSLVEGFGLVLLEAMACGIPVITTPNTAGPDIITDGVEGFIIPIRDTEALQDKLDWCYHHPLELAQMGQAARKKAEQLTWSQYRQRLADCIADVMNKNL
ncbi:MAG: glycosyltransferase family 4 protein [Roseofilum sp. SBFL]|uniref:glycosyltransferase family 4 protein n=1 Tax=unclassified Roseofilum TaxID=2620099 RepID=UPI001B1B8CA2|nr:MULTISPECIES: glycosyltransferase family 4 protein [unclassified Roseofilum]MBP0014383.1 glycosyltransferase family 4 protein [Roseofilum sp. SID3]MBP0025948.1 glycosyltransferase family 4 protein [Roseofilum sp. SID2]MBP0036120.1 glycosyltransferase family 4 protein [Roseofilum sp. SID1]MBP0040488.1 glycosyltransferase family 4 protein [Roseofilum sp. SBFL]